MYCPNCGKKIQKNSKFCPYCGYSLNPFKENISPSKRTQSISISKNTHHKNHKKFIWVIVAIIIIIIAGFGYHQYKQSPVSINLATTMPGHNWKIDDLMGMHVNWHFTKHSVRNSKLSISYGKKYFIVHNTYTTTKETLNKKHKNDYYFHVSKFKDTRMGDSFSGNKFITGSGKIKLIKDGNKVIIINPSHRETFSLNELTHSNNVEIKFFGELLSHKQIKMIKE